MKAARSVIKISGIFSLIMSVLTGTLAVLAILAYNCVFRSFMQRTPLSYMWYLLYFRSSQCDRFIQWHLLGADGMSHQQPDIPDETVAVFRTFILACLYLAVSVLLLITSILLLFSLKREGKPRLQTYALFVVPFLFTLILVIILDIVAMTFYSSDTVRHETSLGIMLTLEFRNPFLFFEHINAIPVMARTLPSVIMLTASAKLFICFMLNILIFVGVAVAGWKFAESSERNQVLMPKDFTGIAANHPGFNYVRSQTPSDIDDVTEVQARSDESNRL